MNNQSYVFGLILAVSSPWLSTFAAPETYVVDQERSSLTISATIKTALGVIPLGEQGPGSLFTHFSGSLHAETTSGSIQFTGQSEVRAVDNGSWRPGIEGVDSEAPANFAGRGQIGTILGTLLGEASLREVVLDLTSEALTVDGQGKFDAGLVLFVFPESATSSFDYRVTGLIGTEGREPLAGESANRVVTQATIQSTSDETIISLPVDIEGFTTILDQDDVQYQLKGQLVAVKAGGGGTPPEPEPFAVSSFSVTPAMGTFEIFTVPGKSYRILSSEDLADWTTVLDQFIAAANATIRDVPIPPIPNQYLRIEEN